MVTGGLLIFQGRRDPWARPSIRRIGVVGSECMKIRIIGSANIGRALGVRLGYLGHEVFFGARTEQEGIEVAKKSGSGASGEAWIKRRPSETF